MLIIFDLDGTLLDSKPCMKAAWAAVQEQHGVTNPFDEYFDLIGRPFSDIMNIMGITDAVENTYFTASRNSTHLSTLYPCVISTLLKLRAKGHVLSIVTSKSWSNTMHILRYFDIEDLFKLVCSPDSPGLESLNGKPEPDHLLHALDCLGFEPNEAVYVGDMDSDYHAAAKAHIKYIHAGWGYGKPIYGATVASSLTELEELI